MTTVQHGSRGKAVVELQQALVDAGYELDVDGDFGDATDTAVREFQADNELDVDGVVGEETWAALAGDEEESEEDESEEEESEEDGPPVLALGARGKFVVALQQRLVELEWELDVDGIFGQDTDDAVREFQEQYELDVDGIVGPQTWAALAP